MTRPWIRQVSLATLAVVAAHLLDPFAWRLLRLPAVYDKDWGRLLRIVGFLPTWGIIALVWWLEQRRTARGARHAGRHAGFLLLAPTLGGLAAELLKVVLRRLRPDPDHFAYAFRPVGEHFWSNVGMGLPSSHVLVAFAGAAALARLAPRSAAVVYALAAGCALTRVLATAHYLSDTVVAACVAVGLVRWLAGQLAIDEATA